ASEAPLMKEPRFRTVQLRVWADARVRSLSTPQPNAQSLLVRLLIAPEAGSLAVLIPIGEAALAEALGWPVKGLRAAFAELEKAGLAKADWQARLVFLPTAWEHDRPRNPDSVLGWRRQLEELPDCDLKHQALRWVREQLALLGENMVRAFA